MTEKEAATVGELREDIQKLAQAVVELAKLYGNPSPQALPVLETGEAEGLDAIIQALQNMQTFSLDQVVSMRYQELVPAGTHFIGDPDKLRAWIRREYIQELQERSSATFRR